MLIYTTYITLISSQIGGSVYNLHRLHPLFSTISSEVQDEVESTMTYLR